MPRSLGLSIRGRNGVIWRAHDGLTRFTRFATVAGTDRIAVHDSALALLTRAEGNNLAAAAPGAEAVTALSTWVVAWQ
jgi:hypothetical protein